MDTLPLHFRLQGQPCLVVGGGVVAQRKCQLLWQAGAVITLVAPEVSSSLQALFAQNAGQFYCRQYQKSDLKGVRLAIAATDDKDLNERIYSDGNELGISINVVDDPDRCHFLFPAIVDRSPVVISVGTQGTHPVLARSIRTKLESSFPANYGLLAQLLGQYRQLSKDRFKSPNERRLFWEAVLEGPVVEAALGGNLAVAEQHLKTELDDYFAGGGAAPMGEVYLVGAGPGDPDLLTFRALRLLQKADIVIYDRLVSESVLALARRDAEMIYVGKRRDHHTISQDEINKLLVQHALKGMRVCRLKGGDPFIFGRGGEEIATLSSQKIPFQVVPGITAASGCAAYAGIPLTHRDYAQSVRFITGHLKEGHLELPWESLISTRETLVFYMGLISLPIICKQLVAQGLSPTMPVALVQQGTLAQQRVYTGVLETFPELIEKVQPKPPSLLIIGEVVNLRKDLNWFSTR